MELNTPVLTVGQLNDRIKNLLDADKLLSNVFIRGEISNYRLYPSGHHYFTLKDDQGVLRCVMFRSSAASLIFKPEDGMKVIARGRVSVFPRDGQYQLYCAQLIAEGAGALYVAYEQLKAKLDKEGLFDPAHKKELPAYPSAIALVTSPAGAAVADMIRILSNRWPMARIIVVPVRVQGAEAPGEICAGIRYADRHQLADLIITGRGGGSIEDLWAFNDEAVARAIFACSTPIMSAVGHEPDVTIADFVADVRAATPSNAAELAVPDSAEVFRRIQALEIRAAQQTQHIVSVFRQKLDGYAHRHALQSPVNYIQDKRMLLDYLHRRGASAAEKLIYTNRERFVRLSAGLDALSPLKVLSRGYSIASLSEGRILKDASAVSPGDTVHLRLERGELDCAVIKQHTSKNGGHNG